METQLARPRRSAVITLAGIVLGLALPATALASPDVPAAIRATQVQAVPTVNARIADPSTWTYDNVPGWTGWPHVVSAPTIAWAEAPAARVEAPSVRPTTIEPTIRTKVTTTRTAQSRTTAAKASTTAKSSSTKKTTTKKTTTKASTSGYSGRNHVWIPSLGVNRSVSFFSCSSSAYPGNRVYRWGCAGSNNVYLFGHAHSVFKPLHDAYYNGKLKKGMKVVYADANGKVRTYKVSYWKVVSPVGAGWAYASLSSPGMTLQTCVGKNSEKRLVVRLTLAS